jgi:hypothetical protein
VQNKLLRLKDKKMVLNFQTPSLSSRKVFFVEESADYTDCADLALGKTKKSAFICEICG